MKYFKNTELAELYHISEKSVRNWIDAAEDGKLDLQLHKENGRVWIANTTKNSIIIEEQVRKGQKFKNRRGYKTITPTDQFYKTYNDKQILDIISNLTIHRESPLQYAYVDGGAQEWDEYANRLQSEKSSNILNFTLDMLDETSDSIDRLIEGYEKVNVIDLGPGNGLPIKSTLERLLKDGRLNSYIPIDNSKDMLEILEKNMKNWFGDKLSFETNLRDISYERFNDLYIDSMDNKTANLVFFLGGTLANFRAPSQILQVINNSMGLHDVLIYSGYLDTPKNRRYFDFYVSPNRKLPMLDSAILDLLNVDESLYDIEQYYNDKIGARITNIRPKVDLSIVINLKNDTRTVDLVKGEPILTWRHIHKNALETFKMFDQNGFDLMQATKSPNQEYMLLAAKVKVGFDNP